MLSLGSVALRHRTQAFGVGEAPLKTEGQRGSRARRDESVRGQQVRDAAGGPVRGELFAVSECCLDELDEFEAVPDLFTREWVDLTDGSTAWAYLYARRIPDGTPSGEEWPFG